MLENIKHDKEAAQKCNSILLKANLSFCQEKALEVLFSWRTALSLLQVPAQSFQSLSESERENEGWPGQCEHVGYPKGHQQLFLCPCHSSTSSRQKDGAGLLPVSWAHFYHLIFGTGSFSWYVAVKKLTFSNKPAPLSSEAMSLGPREAPLRRVKPL